MERGIKENFEIAHVEDTSTVLEEIDEMFLMYG